MDERIKQLEGRVAELEKQVQGQPSADVNEISARIDEILLQTLDGTANSIEELEKRVFNVELAEDLKHRISILEQKRSHQLKSNTKRSKNLVVQIAMFAALGSLICTILLLMFR